MSSDDIIKQIHQRDNKFRVAFVVLMVLVLSVLGGVVLLQSQTISQFKQQSAERAASLKKLQQDNLDASARTNAYLQCLARYFAETDRAALQLTDLDKCSFERNGVAVPGVDVTPSRPSTSLTPAPTQQAPTTPSPTSQTPTTPGEPTPILPVPDVPVIPTPQPVRICVPLTGLCLVL